MRYYVLAALCVITIVNYLQRNSIGPLESTIRKALVTDDSMTGLAGAAFFWIYAIMQIPSGKLAQHWGPRFTLSLYCIGWSIAGAAMALSFSIYELIGYRGIMGAFQAGIFPCATLIMVAWLPASRRGLASALLNSFMLIGGITAKHLTAFLLAPMGWRSVIMSYAVPGVLLGFWFSWWFRNRPENHPGVNAEELSIIHGQDPNVAGKVAIEKASSPRSASIAWQAVLLSLPLWLICAQQFCRAGANRFFDGWLPTYLQEGPLKSMANEAERKAYASHLSALPDYAAIVSGPIGGLISDYLLRRFRRRRIARNGVAIVSLTLAVACYVPVLFVASAEWQVFFFMLGYFAATLAAPCAYALSMDVGGKNLPIVFGAMNMVGNFGAAAMLQAVPFVKDQFNTWNAAIILFMGMHATAAILWLFLNPNGTIGEQTAEE